MRTLIPEQGHYFEVSKLTREQFYSLRRHYENKVNNVCQWEDAKQAEYVGWDRNNSFTFHNEAAEFMGCGIMEDLLTYQDVFLEDK